MTQFRLDYAVCMNIVKYPSNLSIINIVMDNGKLWAIIVACSVNDGMFVKNEHVRQDYALYQVPFYFLLFLFLTPCRRYHSSRLHVWLVPT